VAAGARRLQLPTAGDRLAGLTSERDFGRLASALVRVALDERLAEELVPAGR
jgi:hypothetical protein